MTDADFDPEYVFTHHVPTPNQIVQHEAVHAGAKRFAEVILAAVPHSDDRSAALRLLREAAMMANAAIALGGRLR